MTPHDWTQGTLEHKQHVTVVKQARAWMFPTYRKTKTDCDEKKASWVRSSCACTVDSCSDNINEHSRGSLKVYLPESEDDMCQRANSLLKRCGWSNCRGQAPEIDVAVKNSCSLDSCMPATFVSIRACSSFGQRIKHQTRACDADTDVGCKAAGTFSPHATRPALQKHPPFFALKPEAS